MNILTPWLRSYLPELPVDDRQLAEDLTLRGIAVEGEFPRQRYALSEMDITTNRVDAMNHYGIAREAATIYGVPLKPLDTGLVAHSSTASSSMSGEQGYPVRIEAPRPFAAASPSVSSAASQSSSPPASSWSTSQRSARSLSPPPSTLPPRMAGHGPTHALL